MYRLLLLDDEPNVLAALKRELHFPDLYEIEVFTSPVPALERADEAEFAVAIVDYRLKEVDGIQFLEALRDVQPATTRILCSGLRDQRVLLDAINRAHAFSFIAKPWDKEELNRTVLAGLQEYASVKKAEDMKRQLKEQEAVMNWQWRYIKGKI